MSEPRSDINQLLMIHTGYSAGGYRSYRKWMSRSWRRWGTGPSKAYGEVGHLIVGKW